LIGGVLGVLLASWAVKVLPAILPTNLPRQEGIAISAPVMLFALGATLALALSLGLVAAWRAGGGNLQETLSAGSRTYTGGGSVQRLRGILVVGEIATTLVILVGAGLLGRSFLRLVSTSPGFRQGNLITLQFSLPAANWSSGMDQAGIARQIHLMDDVLTRVRGIPGIKSAGLSGALPVAGGDDLSDGGFLLLHGRKPPANYDEFGQMAHDPSILGHADYCVAGEGYFRAMGIPLIRGRMFTGQDAMNTPHVALISQSLARRQWPSQDPIGETVEFGNMDGNLKPLTIVGIVGDVRAEGLDAPPPSVIYVNYRQRGLMNAGSPTIVMRTTAPVGEIASPARVIFHDLAPDVPVKVSTFAQEMGGWLADRRFLLLLVGLFAAAALALAAIGIYGVVAFWVTRRTQEIGVRLALGAERGDVLRLVLGEGARLAGIGVLIGLVASLAATRLMSSLLFGVKANDGLTFSTVAALLSIVALLASYIPARRAMRVDPMVALRYE
jgi:predicted permease